jgi:hypothetical protein
LFNAFARDWNNGMETQQIMNTAKSHFMPQRLNAVLGWGVLSGILYASGFFTFAFLIPIQYEFSKESKKEGLFSLLVSFVMIVGESVLRFENLKAIDVSLLIQTIMPPLLLLAAIALINSISTDLWKKLTTVTIILSVLFGFMLQESLGTKEMQASIASLLAQMLSNAGVQDIDSLVLLQDYVTLVIELIMKSISIMLWITISGSWWIGTALGSRKKNIQNEEKAIQKRGYNVPQWLLWPSIVAWILLLFALYGEKSGILALVAWNSALLAAFWYALQGFSAISHFFVAKGKRNFTGIIVVLLAMLLLLDSRAGLVIAILAPLLGVTQVWLQYRLRKGA